jgi:hypothetical protein
VWLFERVPKLIGFLNFLGLRFLPLCNETLSRDLLRNLLRATLKGQLSSRPLDGRPGYDISEDLAPNRDLRGLGLDQECRER